MKKILISIPEPTYNYVMRYKKQTYCATNSEAFRNLIRLGLEVGSVDFKKDNKKNLKILSKRVDNELLKLEQELYGKQ